MNGLLPILQAVTMLLQLREVEAVADVKAEIVALIDALKAKLPAKDDRTPWTDQDVFVAVQALRLPIAAFRQVGPAPIAAVPRSRRQNG